MPVSFRKTKQARRCGRQPWRDGRRLQAGLQAESLPHGAAGWNGGWLACAGVGVGGGQARGGRAGAVTEEGAGHLRTFAPWGGPLARRLIAPAALADSRGQTQKFPCHFVRLLPRPLRRKAKRRKGNFGFAPPLRVFIEY